MKVPPNNKGNLAPPNKDALRMLQRVTMDLDREDTGALFWSEDEGFLLKLPDLPQDENLPVPLYLLGLCFMRLNNDPDFAMELIEWSRRKPN